jgi:hypothetical protein
MHAASRSPLSQTHRGRASRPTVRRMKVLAGILAFGIPACFLIWASVRVLRSPEKILGGGTLTVDRRLPLPEGERPPSASELRLLAVVWLVIAAAILALGLAIGLTQ